MAVEAIKLIQAIDAHRAIRNMVKGVGPAITPCLTANQGEVCENASEVGCTSGRDGGLFNSPFGVECPKQLGSLSMQGTAGSAPVNPVLK